jgi:biotin--protein ligase
MATASVDPQPPLRSAVFVYAGEGAGMRSMLSALDALKGALPAATVATITPEEVVGGAWAATAALLVMPGGADLPYCSALGGAGNAAIARYVREGGRYLGLCAGGYYGCARVDFEPGNRGMAVAGPRELAFFPGAAVGAAVPGFQYGSEAGAAAVGLTWRRIGAPPPGGGGGREGVGPWRAVRDYCNGGPVFARLDGRAWEGDGGGMVTVIARYASMGEATPPAAAATSPAPAAAALGGVAALRVVVGRGAAVLCGTHPELAPAAAWLGGDGDVASASLAAELDASAADRAAYWAALLEAAGVERLMGKGRVEK